MDSIYKRQRLDAIKIFEDALKKVHPYRLIQENIVLNGDVLTIMGEKRTLKSSQKIRAIATGKAAGSMSSALEKQLQRRLEDGVAIVPTGYETKLSKINLLKASHPVPDESSILATRRLIEYISTIPSTDIIFYLISGGTSSLLCFPVESISLSDLQETGHILLTCGAPIHEINLIRKRLSRVKGGKLLSWVKGNDLITLIISDIPDNEPADIGSGPTIVDKSKKEEILRVIDRYNLKKKLPQSVLNVLENQDDGTPLHAYDRQSIFMLGSAQIMARKAAKIATMMNYQVILHDVPYDGEAREVAKRIVNEAGTTDTKNKTAFIFVGESTVTIAGNGKGGRNQELALAASIEMQNKHHITLLSAGTDGRDGPTDAAGAIVNAYTVSSALKKGLEPQEYLENNDSYHFFKQTGELLITGPTGNNMMDVQIVLVEK